MTSQNKPQQHGFTIIELLIVIVVIGILAAIVIVAYNGVAVRARNAAWVTEFDGYHKLFLAYRLQNGKYPSMPINDRYCLGESNFQASEINPIIASVGSSAFTPISPPYNPQGYCRDLLSGTTRHESNATLNAALATAGKVSSKQKTRADWPDTRHAAAGMTASYQEYTSDPMSGIWLGVILNNAAGECPPNINDRHYDYGESDAVYCEVRLPEAPF
ncbi:prepilin-type N-terminal cleavage/methylation domain-containing protein [bacterium]|nr:MAG: prepilin-type N-terminal cleavage/methylation domain-containing protein [bacterium]